MPTTRPFPGSFPLSKQSEEPKQWGFTAIPRSLINRKSQKPVLPGQKLSEPSAVPSLAVDVPGVRLRSHPQGPAANFAQSNVYPSSRLGLSQEQEASQLRALGSESLLVNEQDDVLSKVHDRLSQCAFDFVAKYQFPIPLEDDKRPVQVPSDREWTEWAFLLKRLATKRRIPARVLYNGQIKQLVTILENSLEMRHAAKHQSRPLKDDRNILQLISAGLQVAKMLKDAACMEYMDSLYLWTEETIKARKTNPTRGYLR
ncbi:MAG: hypothetical protein L6R37_002094 [Teloschistes peruensis]|nr:MAG: hypothetical protein L6R37_002094 [Teloschistes peruensis]